MDEHKPIPECDLTNFCKFESNNKNNQHMLRSKRQRSVPKRFADENKFYMQKTIKREIKNESFEVTIKKEIKIESFEEVEEMSETENEIPQNDLQSEYEKMVQKNREERLAILEALQIDEIKDSFCRAVQNLRPKPKPKNIKRPPSDVPPAPLRKSRRLAKLDINLSENALIHKALEEAEKNVISQPQELPAVLPFDEALKGKAQFEQGNLYKSFIQDFEGLGEKKAEPYNEYISNFKKMRLHESQIAKVVSSRITALTVHPVYDKTIIVAGDKYGNLGFWKMNSDSNPYLFTPHLEGVTTVKINPFHYNQVVSSSYDGTLRCGDMDRHVFDEIYTVSRDCCTYFDVLSPKTFIVGHKSGKVAVVDHRSTSKTVEKKHQCHDYTVKSVSVHPVDKNYFLSSEVKGSISLWDLRKLQKQPVLKVYQHKKSASSAFFSPLTGSSILSTSTDDSLCIFDSSNLVGKIPLKHLIKHNNYTGRWLSIFRATWLPNVDDAFVVGSMLYPRTVQIYNASGSNIHNFIAEDLTSITSLHAFHPYRPLMACGNSSGKVFVFTDSF